MQLPWFVERHCLQSIIDLVKYHDLEALHLLFMEVLGVIAPIATPVAKRVADILNGTTTPQYVSIGPGIIKCRTEAEIRCLQLMGAIPGVASIVFGGISILPQPGNPRPRLWIGSESWNEDDDGAYDTSPHPGGPWTINAMGLPNPGVDFVAYHLRKMKEKGRMPAVPLWANIFTQGQNIEKKKFELKYLISQLFDFVAGFEFNISCPNHAGSRSVDVEEIRLLVAYMNDVNADIARERGVEPKRLAIKIPPLSRQSNDGQRKDASYEFLQAIVTAFSDMDPKPAIIASNTTAEHADLVTEDNPRKGGLSGSMLHSTMISTVRALRELGWTGEIVASGGIGMSWRDRSFRESVTWSFVAGADRVQMVTGAIRSVFTGIFFAHRIAAWEKARQNL